MSESLVVGMVSYRKRAARSGVISVAMTARIKEQAERRWIFGLEPPQPRETEKRCQANDNTAGRNKKAKGDKHGGNHELTITAKKRQVFIQ